MHWSAGRANVYVIANSGRLVPIGKEQLAELRMKCPKRKASICRSIVLVLLLVIFLLCVLLVE